MHLSIIFKTIGLLLLVFSLTQIPPIFVDFIYSENHIYPFVYALFFTVISGLACYYPFRDSSSEFRIREGIIVVVSFWFILSLFATIPFIASDVLNMNFSEAFFESMSGLTTTGATVISGLDNLPKSILYYRQQLQWLGGMGIIVLAVALLPMLGAGSMELYHAESSGITKERLTPKLTHSAKVLWLIYIVFTIVCSLAYFLAGMSLFDAIGHSFSTVAIGGFSTHDASIGFFQSESIELIAMIFMFLAGINFSLHFLAVRKKSITFYWKDSEFKTYVLILFVTTILVVLYLIFSGFYENSSDSLRHGLFQTISIATTTGFVSTNFSAWPYFVPVILIFASFIGASAGSTGGGIKVVRVLLMFRLAMKEVRKFIHPRGQINIKLNKSTVPESTLVSVWGFFSLYVIGFIIILVLLMFTGFDQVTAFSATAATMNNLGPGLGDVAQNYGNISDTAKWILSFSMLLGRLEILTLMALLHKAFWRF